MMAQEVVKVKREALASHMKCLICQQIFRDATTINECLHTFCRKCIYEKLLDEKMSICPVCEVNLGCAPLDKLKLDHNLQAIIANVFPSKSIEVKGVEMVKHVPLPVKGKEKSISSQVIGTPGPSTSVVMGREPKLSARKTSRRSCNKPLKKNDDNSESSSSIEILNRYTRSAKQDSFATGPFVDPNLDKGKERTSQNSKRKGGRWKHLNLLADASNDEKGKEEMQNSIVYNEMSGKKDTCSEPETQKNLKSGRKKAMNSREPTTPPKVVLNASNAQISSTNKQIWFSLVASDTKDGINPPLPQIPARYIRTEDGRMPVSFIQKYLKTKLNLASEHEVEIKCMGQRVALTSTLNNIVETWLQQTSTERVCATIGSSAKDVVMVLTYARGFPDLNKTPTNSLSS